MRVRLVVAVLAAVLVVYFVLLTDQALSLIRTGTVVAVGLGVGVLLLPIVGAILLVLELRFGAQTQRLGRRLAAQDALPDPGDLPRRPSGRVQRDAADAYFEQVRTRVEANPEDWRGWYSLGYAYDLAGDRKRARAAMRSAIELERRERT